MCVCSSPTRFPLIFLILLSLLQPALAQEPQIDEGGYKLTLGAIPEIESGKATLMSGNTGPDGDKFYLEHLTMFQPVTVYLIAADPATPVRMNLAKYRYDEVAWDGDTGSEGTLAHSFRTQGELKIHVTPASGDGEAAYGLIVWAADLPQPDLPPPVTVAGESSTPGGSSMRLKVAGGIVLLGIIAFVFFRLGRRS